MSNLKPVNPAGLDEEFDSLEEGEIVQLVGLKLGDEEYAIDVLKIQEIIRTVEITSVPRTDSFVLGVMNLRGKVIPVVDLRVRFNLDKMDFDKETRIIVVRFESEHIGFVVDEVTEVIRISKNMVDPTPPACRFHRSGVHPGNLQVR
jgi:chemotaxis signal transduction protein